MLRARLLLFAACCILIAADDSANPALACVKDIALPVYSSAPLAWAARAIGQYRTVVSLGADATVASVETEPDQPPVLPRLIESALRSAKFSANCAGRMLTFTFIYRLDGKPNKYLYEIVKLKAPDTIEIVANPPLPIPPQP